MHELVWLFLIICLPIRLWKLELHLKTQHFLSTISNIAEYTDDKYLFSVWNSSGKFDQIVKGFINFAIRENIREINLFWKR